MVHRTLARKKFFESLLAKQIEFTECFKSIRPILQKFQILRASVKLQAAEKVEGNLLPFSRKLIGKLW